MKAISIIRSGVAALAVYAAASTASAGVSLQALRIEVSAGAFSGVLDIDPNQLVPNGPALEWVVPGIVTIFDGATALATINSNTTIFYQNDPNGSVIGLTAELTNETGLPLTVSIQSGLFSFAGINPATGFANVGLTATDSDNSGLVSVSANGAGGKIAAYDYNGLVPGGTMFARLGNSYASPPASPSTSDDTGGIVGIAGTVNDMSLRLDYILSANDSFSTTAAYAVLPEPASALLIAFGLFAGLRRGR